MLFAPEEWWRVTEPGQKLGLGPSAPSLDEDYPHKDRMVLVLVRDNLNPHHPSSLYEEFEPAEARRIAERLEIHYTPKHGSWLDMAEIEIGGWRQCLDRRIPDQSALRREVERGSNSATGTQYGQNHQWSGASLPRILHWRLHHLGCPQQTEVPLPINTTLTDY